MAFNINDFKANFGDGAKSNLFYYKPQFPPGVAEMTPDQAMYLVKSTQFPSTTLDEAVLSWQGMDWKMATKHTYSDITISFNVDYNAKIRMLFEDWSKMAHNPATNEYGLHSDYMADQILQMLGYNGTVIMEAKLVHAWPKEVGQITLDYSSAEIATFDVTWTYAYHELSFEATGGNIF